MWQRAVGGGDSCLEIGDDANRLDAGVALLVVEGLQQDVGCSAVHVAQ